MVQARKPNRLRPRGKSLLESLREFLTPEVWKQVRKTTSRRKMPRWDVHPLLLVLLTMTWCCGDSLPEKFEAARGFYVVWHDKRRRPGETFQGFQQAVGRLPVAVLRALAQGIRGRIEQLLADRWWIGKWIPFGCDGSRLECPRTAELERHLGQGGKADSAPTVWVTAIVHLLTGVPWTWCFGRGSKPSERKHLVQMLKYLPRQALVIADAGYYGYDLMLDLLGARVSFLIRMSSTVTLYTEEQTPLEDFCEGLVYYWPEWAQKKELPPVPARLLCVRDRKRKVDVWLLTDLTSSQQLSLADANRFYRWRWENEGYFRTYKRTLAKMKLMSRTIREIHREAEASMIATQLLLAQGAQALPKAHADEPRVLCSPRKALLEVRRELAGHRGVKRRGRFSERLKECCRERRERSSPKAIRSWPRRKDHKPPGPPTILKLTAAQKHLISRTRTAA
jgi:hypothetical protein